MMGGGGGFTGTLDVDKIIASANDRIRDAFREGEYVLFAASADDREEIAERIANTEQLKNLAYQIVDDRMESEASVIDKASLVVVYAGSPKSEKWLVDFVRKVLAAKKAIVATRSKSAADGIPQYVSQYRMRMVSWSDLVELLAP